MNPDTVPTVIIRIGALESAEQHPDVQAAYAAWGAALDEYATLPRGGPYAEWKRRYDAVRAAKDHWARETHRIADASLEV